MFFGSKDYKSTIIEWNNKFPLDKWFREKYKIPFNSSKHREVNQIDVYFEWVEDFLFKKYSEDNIRQKTEEEDFKKGIIVKERQNKSLEDDFDNLDIKKLQQSIDKMNE